MKQKTESLSTIVGENLKRSIRVSKWKTQSKFAEIANVDERTVGRWCNNGIDSLTEIYRLANLLEMEPSALLP